MILTVNLWDQLGILQNKFNICRFTKDCVILACGSESTLKTRGWVMVCVGVVWMMKKV